MPLSLQPHTPGRVNRIAKRLAPIAARLLAHEPSLSLLRLFDIYLAIVGGQGAGSGWDLAGEVRTAALHIRRPNAVIFDVGSHRGEWSSGVSRRLAGAAQRFFLFEPQPACRPALEAIRLPHKVFLPVAVGECAGVAELYVPAPGSPLATLYPRRDSYHQAFHYSRTCVPMTTIDAVASAYGLDCIDFLKLDVEGHELAVLRGARTLVGEGRLKAFSFEFGSANINSRTFFHDFWDLLHSSGFSLSRIAPGGVLIPILHYYEDLEYYRGATNYLAVAQP